MGAKADQTAEDILYNDAEPMFGDLDAIAERRLLRVLVTHSNTDFFLDGGSIRGIQADIVQELLKHLNEGRSNRYHASETNKFIVQYIPVEFDQLIPALIEGKGDIAAAFLTATAEREAMVDFVSTGKRSVDEILVAHADAPAVNTLADLSGRDIHVLRGSSYATHLQQLAERFELVDIVPPNIVEADEQLLTEDILELVNAGIIDYTVSDDFKAELWAEVLPSVRLHPEIPISEDHPIGWAIREDSPLLKAELTEFAGKVAKGTLLGNILFRRYFENTEWINNPNAQEEREKLDSLAQLFERYGNEFEFDPLALTAQAFQESKLNNELRSHRGAIGIMQLMPSTAKDPNVDVDDVEELENNIHAGAKYLRFLRDRYFSDDDIDLVNQRLFAWAAYNAGPANVARIRRAAEEEGLDPNVWFNNVEHMAAKKISREPVRYVANIYKYYTAYKLVEARANQTDSALREVVN